MRRWNSWALPGSTAGLRQEKAREGYSESVRLKESGSLWSVQKLSQAAGRWNEQPCGVWPGSLSQHCH